MFFLQTAYLKFLRDRGNHDMERNNSAVPPESFPIQFILPTPADQLLCLVPVFGAGSLNNKRSSS